MLYHIGLIREGEKVIVQARRNIDLLDEELWRYLGVRDITKEYLRASRKALLDAINQKYGAQFQRIQID